MSFNGVALVFQGLQSFLGIKPIGISDVSQKISAAASWIFSQTADAASSITSRDVAIATTTCSFGIVFGLYIMHRLKKQAIGGVNIHEPGLNEHLIELIKRKNVLHGQIVRIYLMIDREFERIENGSEREKLEDIKAAVWKAYTGQELQSGSDKIEKLQRRKKQMEDLWDPETINARIGELSELMEICNEPIWCIFPNGKFVYRGEQEIELPDFIARNIF